MPIYRNLNLSQKINNIQEINREPKVGIADNFIRLTIDFLNNAFREENLQIAPISLCYDPTHESRWLHFFLRESIRNSIDSYLDLPFSELDCIEITITLKTKDNGQLHLKIKDNGIGFKEKEIGAAFTSSPKASPKNVKTCLGGKGFGLDICAKQLASLTFKNRKWGGASVQYSLGDEEQLKMNH